MMIYLLIYLFIIQALLPQSLQNFIVKTTFFCENYIYVIAMLSEKYWGEGGGVDGGIMPQIVQTRRKKKEADHESKYTFATQQTCRHTLLYLSDWCKKMLHSSAVLLLLVLVLWLSNKLFFWETFP